VAHDVVTAADSGNLEAVPLQRADDADARDGGARALGGIPIKMANDAERAGQRGRSANIPGGRAPP
jgi:hypothetical protein